MSIGPGTTTQFAHSRCRSPQGRPDTRLKRKGDRDPWRRLFFSSSFLEIECPLAEQRPLNHAGGMFDGHGENGGGGGSYPGWHGRHAAWVDFEHGMRTWRDMESRGENALGAKVHGPSDDLPAVPPTVPSVNRGRTIELSHQGAWATGLACRG